MTALMSTRLVASDTSSRREGSMPFLLQITTMAWRTLITNLRVPAVILPPLIISIFFLLVYNASLSGAAAFFLQGQSYLGFVLPLSIVSGALSGAGVAGQSLVRDIESGYFDKLMLTPVSRAALLLGPMLAGAVLLGLQAILVVFVAVLMGLQPVTGVGGIFAIVGFALLLGSGFAGFTIGIALRTGNAAATQSAGFLFFPLSFLTATFVPYDLLTGWIKTAAFYNPITYILDAMRTILNAGWQTDIILRGVGSCLVMGVVLFIWSAFSLRARTRRK
ncbi:MAG TPA: ABC transporter permease [Phototrophicaceae bacterium]|nr:ABC transporter permease [Phototrophicaceae bacterium]